jgi:hypothetical protein
MKIKDLYQKKVQTFNNHVALERVSNAMQQVTQGEIAIGMEKVALLLRVSVSSWEIVPCGPQVVPVSL